jgi:O-antigen/teichoic acid export membrane protein
VGGVVAELRRAVSRRVAREFAGPAPRDALGTFLAIGAAVTAGFAAGLVLARMLGPEGRGLFELARTVAYTTAIAAGLGLGRAVIFFRGRAVISRQELFGAVSGLLASSTVVAAVLAAALLATGWEGLDELDVALACASLPLIVFYIEGHTALRGIGLEAWFRRTLATRDAAFLVLLPLALALRVDVSVALVAWAAHWLLGAAVIAWLLHRACGRPRAPGRATRRMLVFGASQALVGLLMHVHLRVDLFILQAFRDASEVGHYAVAFGVTEPLSYAGLAIAVVLFPQTAARTADDRRSGSRGTLRALYAAIAPALAGAAVLAVGGPALVEMLLGSDFAPAGDPLRALLPGSVALAALLVLQSDIAGRGRIWTLAGVTASVVVAKAALAAVLVPAFGATGAAAASSSTYVLGAALLFVTFQRATAGATPDAGSSRHSADGAAPRTG